MLSINLRSRLEELTFILSYDVFVPIEELEAVELSLQNAFHF